MEQYAHPHVLHSPEQAMALHATQARRPSGVVEWRICQLIPSALRVRTTQTPQGRHYGCTTQAGWGRLRLARSGHALSDEVFAPVVRRTFTDRLPPDVAVGSHATACHRAGTVSHWNASGPITCALMGARARGARACQLQRRHVGPTHPYLFHPLRQGYEARFAAHVLALDRAGGGRQPFRACSDRPLESACLRDVVQIGLWSTCFRDGGPLPAPGSGSNALDGVSAAEVGFHRTQQWLQEHGRSSFVLGPVPVFDRDVPAALALESGDGSMRLDRGRRLQDELHRPFFAALGRAPNSLRFADPLDWMCNPECTVLHGQQPMYKDRHHLSTTGALRLREPLERALRDSGIIDATDADNGL